MFILFLFSILHNLSSLFIFSYYYIEITKKKKEKKKKLLNYLYIKMTMMQTKGSIGFQINSNTHNNFKFPLFIMMCINNSIFYFYFFRSKSIKM